MFRIPCPYCGPRDQTEFQYGGEASVRRPSEPEVASDAEWAAYLFYRDNLKGMHVERWVHRFGCRQWFLLERDTETHAMGRSWTLPAGDGADPGGPGEESG